VPRAIATGGVVLFFGKTDDVENERLDWESQTRSQNEDASDEI
jgi:hypothetical protein